MANKIHETAIIYPNVILGDNVYIGAYSVIGAPPEHRDYFEVEKLQPVYIQNGAKIFEFVSIHAGTRGPTYIGENAAIFNHSHIAHDVEIGDEVTVAGHSTIGGHVVVGDFAFIGSRSTIHQHCVVGAYAMTAMGSNLHAHIPVGEMWMGHLCRYGGVNHRGLSRRNLTLDQAKELYDEVFLFHKGASKL